MRTVIAIVLLTSSLRAQTGADREILAARDSVWRAWYTNDTAALHRFIPPAAAVLDGTPQRWSDRNAILEGARRLASTNARLVDVQFAYTEIQRAGATASVRSNYRVVTETGARRDTTRGRATELFVKSAATWVNPYWQLEAIAKGASREIPLADTLGAAFSIADSAASKGQATDYDRLVGMWEFRFQSRAGDGTFLPSFTGHWTFDKKTGGGLVEDRWRPDDASIPMAISLYTYRTFEQEKKVWYMHGTHAYGGDVQPGLTWAEGDALYAIQRNGNVLSRIKYTFLSDDHFLWRSDGSQNGGKTWMLDAGTMEARRIGK